MGAKNLTSPGAVRRYFKFKVLMGVGSAFSAKAAPKPLGCLSNHQFHALETAWVGGIHLTR